jgi:hypothetical protein
VAFWLWRFLDWALFVRKWLWKLNGLRKITPKSKRKVVDLLPGFYGLTHSAFGLKGRLVVLLR